MALKLGMMKAFWEITRHLMKLVAPWSKLINNENKEIGELMHKLNALLNNA